MIKKYISRLVVILLTVFMLLGISGCAETEDSISKSTTTSIKTSEETNEITTELDSEIGEIQNQEDNEELPVSQIPVNVQSSNENISLSNIPAYTGNAYVAVNNNNPYFTDADKSRTDAFETYSNPDGAGRCGVSYANICTEIMPTEKRGKIGSVKPTGWHTVKYDIVDGKYLYNRCHLIGFQLAGENANNKNLITGTRYLNVTGMLPFENMVSDYVKETNNHVLYRVTPVFEGNNLLASGVLIEAYSVEDGGAGITFCVYCYNVQPGIDINYANGDSSLAAAQTQTSVAQTPAQTEPPTTQPQTQPQTQQQIQTEVPQQNVSVNTYIINTNTGKFHYPNCKSVNQMADKNKLEYTGTRDEVIAQGYAPCQNCKP